MTGGSPVGSWKMDFQQGDYNLVLGDDLTGSLRSASYGESSVIRNVRVTGDKIRFAFTMNKGDSEVELDFVGQLVGNRHEGRCQCGGFEFPLNGVRQ